MVIFHSFRATNRNDPHKKIFENKDFCNVIISSENIKILDFNQYHISDKAAAIIYADLECFIKQVEDVKLIH